MGNRIYSISEISKLCNLTQKQLRYYEERKLIDKVDRNPDNNYRYYTQDHVKQLFIIREYRLLGFTLDEIYQLLHESSISTLKTSIRRRLVNAREKLRTSVLEYEKGAEKFSQIMEAVSILDARMKSNEEVNKFKSYEVIDYPEKEVVAISHRGTFFDEDKTSKEHLAQLYVIAERFNLTILGPLIFNYLDHFIEGTEEFNHRQRRIEIAFPIVEMSADCTYCKKLAGFKGISTIHIGNYDTSMIESYQSLKKWGEEQGYHLSNSSVEEYLIGSELTNKKELWVTRIMIPFVD